MGIVINSASRTFDPHSKQGIDALMMLRITRLLRVLRVARIFKMSKKFDGLFALAYALKTGASELALLSVLLSTCVILFSSLVYFANESDANSPFSSVVDAFWWSVVTMSTVGYGDQVPTTFLAKLVGVFTALGGILVLSLPFPIISSRFNKYYELQKKLKGTNISNGMFIQPSFAGVLIRGDITMYRRRRTNDVEGDNSDKVVEDDASIFELIT
eukprot:sb/3470054/